MGLAIAIAIDVVRLRYDVIKRMIKLMVITYLM